MECRKRNHKKYALALAALLLLSCVSLMQTHAANEVDLNKECSLTVSVDVTNAIGSSGEYLEDFNRMQIPVSVYRVAAVDAAGQMFTPEETFAELDFDQINKKPSAVTAADWQTLAEQAEKIREASLPQEDGSVIVQKQEGAEAAVGTIAGLKPGMYLVVPKESYNPDYSVKYAFAPYLTALPSSAYTLEGTGSDAWNYDTTIGLKPDAQDQYGKLHIVKTLENYNETLGKATFVFHIVGKDKDGNVRYDEVESMTYSAAGSETITIEKIPAGLTMTVTEVYSGASYTAVGSREETAVVWSDAAVEAGAGSEASVAFRNRYDGGNRSGYGVTNRFESDGAGGWTWENPTKQKQQ
jgi:hypothetical protein